MTDHIRDNEESDISLLDLLIELGHEKLTLILVTLLATVTGVVVSLSTAPIYVSRTIIMPSQQSGSGSGVSSLANLAGLTGLGGFSSMTSAIKSSEEMYISLMRSHSVQAALIDQLKLKERYRAKNTEEARQTLTSNVMILADKKTGLILIDAQDKDPEFAAHLANAQVKELNVILSRLAVTEVQQRRAFYEHQIIRSQAIIPSLEKDFKDAQISSGLEVSSLISDAATLPGQIAAKELQLQILSRFFTDQNPELKRLSKEISALRAQLDKYALNKTETLTTVSNKLGEASQNPKANFIQKATQSYNTLKIQEALLEGYFRQLELAKVDEAKEGPAIQIVDHAKAPEIRATPERRKMVLAYTVTGSIIGLMLAVLRVFIRNVKSTSEGRQRLIQLKRAWGFD